MHKYVFWPQELLFDKDLRVKISERSVLQNICYCRTTVCLQTENNDTPLL